MADTNFATSLIVSPPSFANRDFLIPAITSHDVYPTMSCYTCGCTCRFPPLSQGSYHGTDHHVPSSYFDPSLWMSSNRSITDVAEPLDAVQPTFALETPPVPAPDVVLSHIAAPQLNVINQRLFRPRGKDQRSTFGSISIDFRKTDGTPFTVLEALDANYVRLNGRDDPMNIIQQSSSVYARIEWPGYPAYKRQIRTTTWTRVRRPITRAKLATEIAKALNDFITGAHGSNPDAAVGEWTVGPRGSDHITVDRLALVSLDRVSLSSWQPVFCLI